MPFSRRQTRQRDAFLLVFLAADDRLVEALADALHDSLPGAGVAQRLLDLRRGGGAGFDARIEQAFDGIDASQIGRVGNGDHERAVRAALQRNEAVPHHELDGDLLDPEDRIGCRHVRLIAGVLCSD